MRKTWNIPLESFFFEDDLMDWDGTARISKQKSAKGRGLGKKRKCKGVEKEGTEILFLSFDTKMQTQTCLVRYW